MADRFLDVLERTPAPPSNRLPSRFDPLVRTIVGHTDITMRVDEAARAALRSVGKRAATIQRTILLADAPERHPDVLAHELTHVANPSPHPRFYADDVDTAEERHADDIARLVLQRPSIVTSESSDTSDGASTEPLGRLGALPTPPVAGQPGNGIIRRSMTPADSATAADSRSADRAGTDGLPVMGPMSSAGSAPTVTPGSSSAVQRSTFQGRPPRMTSIRRSTSRAVTSSTAAEMTSAPAGTVAAAAAAAAGAASLSTIRRSVAAPSDNGGPGSSASVVRRALDDQRVASQPALDPAEGPAGIIENLRRTGGVVDFVDWIVEQVEDRVIAELQRRGGRFREDF